MGRSPCCQKEGLKKGPWTQDEDEKLIAYVKEHGHGNWRALPKKCGLLRCGKSCRLRWTNYLRPDIKRGLFTHSEEQKIILLHALVGNKWAFIASQLPKRTDNEIKNFWNTVLRKRLHKQSLMISTSTQLQNAAGQTNCTLKQGNKKSSSSSSKRSNSTYMQQQSGILKSSINTSRTSSMQQGIIKSSSHLAQWESARLEAEARLAKESQSSKTLKLLSFNLGSFSDTATTTTATGPFTDTATTTTTTTTTTDVPFTTATTTTSVAPFPSTTTPFTSFSTTQYPSHDHHYPCTIAHFLSHTSYPSMISPSPSAIDPSSSPILSSASMISLSSQERISSALTLRPNGRLCWKTQELAFTSYASSQKNRNRSIKLDMDNQRSADKDAGASGVDMAPEEGDHDGGYKEEQEIMVDLNSMMSLPSGDNWQDLLFDGCSDNDQEVSATAAWRSQLEMIEPISTSHNIIINDDDDDDVGTDTATLLISNNNLGLIQCSPMHVPHVPSEAHAKLSHHHHHNHHHHQQKHAHDHASYMDLDIGITLSHIDSLVCDYTANQHKSSVLKEICPTPPTPLNKLLTSSLS